MKKAYTAKWSCFVLLTTLGISTLSAPVTALAEPAKEYQIGDQVEVQWPGDDKWYAAKVTDKKDGCYFIVYDQDGNNAWYNPERIRLVKAAPLPVIPAQPTTPTAPDSRAKRLCPHLENRLKNRRVLSRGE